MAEINLQKIEPRLISSVLALIEKKEPDLEIGPCFVSFIKAANLEAVSAFVAGLPSLKRQADRIYSGALTAEELATLTNSELVSIIRPSGMLEMRPRTKEGAPS